MHDTASRALLRRAVRLVVVTAVWNVIEGGGSIVAGLAARSIALTGFGLDSLVEVFASAVAAWQLARPTRAREARAVRLIAVAFVAVGLYIGAESLVRLARGEHAEPSELGIVLTAAAVVVMTVLGAMKRRVARHLDNDALRAEANFSLVDAGLSGSVLVGLLLTALAGWWWSDGGTALVVAAFALREGVTGLRATSADRRA
jgi:divalent metal cation (Fe/Co/Zn/Cd) transporter